MKAGNRSVTSGSKTSYLASNLAAGARTIPLVSVVGFAVNDYILLGEIGSETTEIVQLLTLPPATDTFTCAATKFAHPESTAAYIIPFNQVCFYWTATDTWDGGTTVLSGYIPIQVDDLYTKFNDVTRFTGYGWFTFYNSTTTVSSTNSNAIPYGDFAENSVKKILDTFFSMLNNKESSLISRTDAMGYLNEAFAKATNELNLVSVEWNTRAVLPINIIGGTQEYLLPADFSDVISIVDNTGLEMENVNLKNVLTYRASMTSRSEYYLRGKYIGFVPVPLSSVVFQMYYKGKAVALTSPYTTIDLPDNNFYPLLDFMLFRSGMKIGRSQADLQMYMGSYKDGIAIMKQTSVKQSANLDSWTITSESNV